MRGATGIGIIIGQKYGSIHTPRTGCDGVAHVGAAVGFCFNPRTPHGVRRGFYNL